MDSAWLLLWISLGLTVVFFIAIVCTWLYSYTNQIIVNKSVRALEDKLSFLLEQDEEKRMLRIQGLRDYVKSSSMRKELLIKILAQYDEELYNNNYDRIIHILEQTEVLSFLMKLLTSNDSNKQALACRYIGDLRIASMKESMYKLNNSSHNDVIYNQLLALAKIGDLEGLSTNLSANSGNINLSFRAVVEVINSFEGSKEQLIKETIELSDDYMKGILIKASADNDCKGLIDSFVKYSTSDNKNLRIACVRAISDLKDAENEQYVIDMLDDKDWEVRAAAAKSLEKLGTDKSFEALGKTVNDSEWWVRQNAASTLIAIPGGREYADVIINGEDKYARDAISGALQMSS